MLHRRPATKIVCTIGPSSQSPDTLEAMIAGGMSVARLNFSHGSQEEHAEKIRAIRKISRALDQPVAVLQDLAGPKIRVGDVPEPGVVLEPGQEFVLTTETIQGSATRVSVSYEGFPDVVHPGDRILLADGFLEIQVREIQGRDILCRVLCGGVLTSHKGVNLPSRSLPLPSLTDKDRLDLLFGLEQQVDYVAVSFVRCAEDVSRVRDIVQQSGGDAPIIAKIEKHEAIRNMEEILEAADGLMVARGDLGVEIPLEQVPGIQKRLIQLANEVGKPVITATQMLRSMVDSPRPSRAEATDVANAVLDGTDAVMLSEETAVGHYPVRAVEYMSRIIHETEKHYPRQRHRRLHPGQAVSRAVAQATCILAEQLKLAAIVAPTKSGLTARNISSFRPETPILALAPAESTVRRLTLFWGCFPRLLSDARDTDDMLERASEAALESRLVSRGDLVVVTAGHPVWVAGTTNMMQVKRLGEKTL